VWYKGIINPIWDENYKSFPYSRQPLTQHEERKWRAAGYTNEYFTGVMYNSRNPMPAWCDIVAKQIGLSNCGFVFYKMTTGIIMPTHVDHYFSYCQVFNIERSKVYRAIVFLEDWNPGHYFEIDGSAIVNYSRGEYVLWSADVPHAASNIGLIDRYTLQITGII
jgi:hypothetical protein